MKGNIVITNHAFQRAKERFNWSQKVLSKMAKLSFEQGITHKETKGTLNKYITKIWFDYKQANNVRIYGENVFLFCDNTLITLYQIPNNLRKHVKLYC